MPSFCPQVRYPCLQPLLPWDPSLEHLPAPDPPGLLSYPPITGGPCPAPPCIPHHELPSLAYANLHPLPQSLPLSFLPPSASEPSPCAPQQLNPRSFHPAAEPSSLPLQSLQQILHSAQYPALAEGAREPSSYMQAALAKQRVRPDQQGMSRDDLSDWSGRQQCFAWLPAQPVGPGVSQQQCTRIGTMLEPASDAADSCSLQGHLHSCILQHLSVCATCIGLGWSSQPPGL